MAAGDDIPKMINGKRRLQKLVRLPSRTHQPRRRKRALTFLASIAKKPKDDDVRESLLGVGATAGELKYVGYKVLEPDETNRASLSLPKDCEVLLRDELTKDEEDLLDKGRGVRPVLVVGYNGRKWEGGKLKRRRKEKGDGRGKKLVLKDVWGKITTESKYLKEVEALRFWVFRHGDDKRSLGLLFTILDY